MSEEGKRPPEPIDFRDELQKVVNAEPFVPFTLWLASGREVEVGSHHAITITRDMILLLSRDDPSVHIRLVQIVGYTINDRKE